MDSDQPQDIAVNANGQQDNEKRRAARHRVLKGVKVSFGDEYCAVEGIVRNLSETGALIQVKDGFIVPDKVAIHNELDGYKVDCEVIRRQGNQIGVRFTGPRIAIEATRHQVVRPDISGQGDEEEEPEPLEEPQPEPESESQEAEFESRYRLRQRPNFGKLR